MINKHLTYEEWFNEYKDYKDAYKNYVKLQSENDELQYENMQLKKQKDDVVDWIKNNFCYVGKKMTLKPFSDLKDLLRMLGEIDD